MKRSFLFLLIFIFITAFTLRAQTFSLESVLSYPFPSELTAANTGSKIAWAMNEQGRRNLYVAEGPDFNPRKLTSYDKDDGQEITSLSISNNGKWVVFVRGGDHSSREGSVSVNPSSDPAGAKVELISIPFEGGKPIILAEADHPAISPANHQVAFLKNSQVWISPLDGSLPAKQMFHARGQNGAISWSPDGSKLAFVSSRGDHSFIGVYTDETRPINWITPAFSRDFSPRWSPDGKNLAFIRMQGQGGATDSLFARKHQPWAIWNVDLSTGNGIQVWKAPETVQGSLPGNDKNINLNWAANNRLVFISYQDGWQHLYAVSASGGQPAQLLTPGNFMVEQVNISSDGKWLVFAANTGKDPQDIDRRHIVKVPTDKPAMEILSSGTGLETYPVFTGDNSTIALLSSTAQRPLLPAVMSVSNRKIKLLAEEMIPASFPGEKLVVPKQVTFKAPDGKTIHAQLFEPKSASKNKPAIVYVHGGPQRQMVLGWHFMDYYSIDYALNQYLTSLGFTVLSVNYRLGIGYGFDFHKPKNGGPLGASEYQDIKAAAEWLAAHPGIDATRIGIYGGSYGGYLTALALGRDSKLFAAGVDIHGVNNRFSNYASEGKEPAPDALLAAKAAIASSPVTYLDTWTSPTLIIHADDDRNVSFSQSVDLARRFEDKKFEFELLAIPDDTHHWMKHSNAVKVSKATADFLKRKLLDK
ncbi:dipeptidyl aminopeptidase/acylaminoacyl peptidase [Pedobacter africanus]|uniref:Dipeptidyl aminopeptidase/acylaminoacyl peptidase n=1 Tax=Pedobacter africanus TaxID=151894 RepID=A0ACC6KRV2_9SPHI|nr:prolyl oligopeptidase family serine peptidase [Pedobacter africanus]MDR6781831.1 dipeptidyl aminopeptidase/acylaminoacyl peptidase [Pedobacter africanus]